VIRSRAVVALIALAALGGAGCGGDDDDTLLADGTPCTLPADCASAECLALPEGSRCGRTCEEASDCGAMFACGIGVVAGEPAGLCGQAGAGAAGAACVDDDDCSDLLCADHLCLEACADVCARDCSPAVLLRGGHDVERSVCPPAAPGPDVVLGPLPTGATGESELATFDVPAGVAAFSISVIDAEGLRVAVASLVAPDGTVVADADGEPAGLQRVHHYIGVASALVPATDDARARVQAGTYGLVVGTYDPAVFDALQPVSGGVERVEITFTREGTQGGLLDLELHWAPALGITAADAPANATVTELLAQIQALLGQARIHVGNVGHHDLPADADTVEDGYEARALCTSVTTPGPRHRSVNVLVVADLSFTAGFAGGIPGPTGLHGTNASGIVAESLGGGHDTGTLLAHEIGHFLGLRHTTEIGAVHDDVSDTAECPADTKVSQCPDYANLMFPIFPLWDGLALSPGQIGIVSASPMLTEPLADAACAGAPWVVDVTETSWAAGDTSRLAGTSEGSCGGTGAPEAAHLLRVTRTDLATLAIRVTATGFAPTVHVRKGADCAAAEDEVACATGAAGEELVVPIDPPDPGPYFVFVDGAPGGAYVLAVDAS
jgi:hypothetical protein